jgi:hypothetical protein
MTLMIFFRSSMGSVSNLAHAWAVEYAGSNDPYKKVGSENTIPLSTEPMDTWIFDFLIFLKKNLHSRTGK